MAIINMVDIVDNSGTFYEEVIKKNYPENEWDSMLINTKILRFNLLKIIKDFITHEKTICIKEFSDSPAMIYDDPEKFTHNKEPEISTDLIIIKKNYNFGTISQEIQKVHTKYGIVLEALNTNNVSQTTWDTLLDDIWLSFGNDDNLYNSRVKKIVLEDTCTILEKWKNYNDSPTVDMLKYYNLSHNVNTFNKNTYWQEPLYNISKKYWQKFSFVLTINDFDIYDETKQELLNVIAERYFNNGYFDEIVIKMNYLYWFDDYKKIVEWTEKNLKSSLVSYRFDTIFSNGTKNRYFSESEALLYNDIQRPNTINEEALMYKERIPLFLNKIMENPQTFGFELIGGYFGMEGEIPHVVINSDDFSNYKDYICNTMSMTPFANPNDKFVRIFKDPTTKVFICIKRG